MCRAAHAAALARSLAAAGVLAPRALAGAVAAERVVVTGYARVASKASMLFVVLGETLAGLVLAALLPVINEYPHILALYPVMAAARGNIYASFGSRITSRLHLGLEDPSRPLETVRRELPRLLVQGVVSALFSATIALAALTAADRLVDPLQVYGTALLTPLIVAPVLSLVAVYAAVAGFRRGLDPDDFLTPLITVAADILVLPAVTAAALTASRLGPASLAPAAALAIIPRLPREHRRVVAENTSAILAGSAIEVVRSYLLVAYLPFFNHYPYVLATLPTFNAENGAALGALAARVSTMLHLGTYPGPAPRLVARDALRAYTDLAPAYAITALIITASMGAWATLPRLLALLYAGGALVTTTMTLLTHATAKKAFEHGLDPDNIVIPLVTTITDSAGTLTLLALATIIY